MKTLALLVALLISNFITKAQEEPKGITITVTVSNMISYKEEVLFGLYDENTCMKAAPLYREKTKLLSPKCDRFGSDCKSAKDNTQERYQ